MTEGFARYCHGIVHVSLKNQAPCTGILLSPVSLALNNNQTSQGKGHLHKSMNLLLFTSSVKRPSSSPGSRMQIFK